MGVGKWKKDTSRNYRTTVSAEESKIYNMPYEVGEAIDDNGNLIFEKTDYNAHYVEFSEEECQQMRGQTYTHNHIDNGVFSDADVQLMTDYGIKTLRATFGDKVYELTESGGKTNGKAFADDYHNYMRTTEKNMTWPTRRAYLHEEISDDEFDKQMDTIEGQWLKRCSGWLRNNAEKYGYKYSIRKRV